VVAFNASRESKQMVAPEIDFLDKYVQPAILKRFLSAAMSVPGQWNWTRRVMLE
jgi:hypothetical protein